jgi:hypothetical protein
VAKYGIPRNNDASIYSDVVIPKEGEELKAATKMIHAFARCERLGFWCIFLGIILMLFDRNLQ